MCSQNHLIDMTKDESKRILRRLELDAYSNLVTALRAQGILTKRRKKLLEDASNILNISIDRHKAEIRRAVNDECLSTIADILAGPRTNENWEAEGRRTIGLLRRECPETAFRVIADQAIPDDSLSIPSISFLTEKLFSKAPQPQKEPQSPPKKMRLDDEESENGSTEKESDDIDSQPQPSTSNQNLEDSKKSLPKSIIIKTSLDKAKSSISIQPSTSCDSTKSRLRTSPLMIPLIASGANGQEKSNICPTIEGLLSGNESSNTSSSKDTRSSTPSSESASSPKPVEPTTTKSNVVIVQKKNNSQSMFTRNVTIPQETIKKLINTSTQTKKQKLNPSQGNVIVVDLSQQQQSNNSILTEFLQASGLMAPSSPSNSNNASLDSEETETTNLSERENNPIQIEEEQTITGPTEYEKSDEEEEENIELETTINVPEPIHYEETTEELIETEVLGEIHPMDIVGEMDPETGLYSKTKTMHVETSISSKVSN